MSNLPEGLRTAPGASSYFDWASLSPLCTSALNAQTEYLRASAAATDATAHMRSAIELDPTRATLKAFVDGREHDQVVLARSASELLSVFANGLHDDGHRTTVLLCEPNHPCVPLAWRGAGSARGLHVRSLPCTSNFEIDLEALEKELTEHCLAVVATHVDHLHGVVQPIKAVADLVHEVGAALIVDGAQAAGRIGVSVSALHADAYLAVGRKSLMAPLGTAFAVATPSLLERTSPFVWSTRSANLRHDGPPIVAASPLHVEGNLPDLGALAGLHGAVENYTPSALARLQGSVRTLLPLLFEGLTTAGLRPLRSLSNDNAGIASFSLPVHANGLQVQHKLRLSGFVVAANEEELRVSLHLANHRADIDRLIRKVRDCV